MECNPRSGEPRGLIFNIQRFSIDDGPGIRTTVFMKGCPLRCAWCQNPEGLSTRKELMWFDTRCIGARDCISACPHDALGLTAQGMMIERDSCDGCGKCADACPAGALEVVGKEYTIGDLLYEVFRDEVFYRNSKGGVTLSGGEPLMQPAFASEFVRKCHERGLHVALDTCGHSPKEIFAELVDLSDMVLFDLKTMDIEKHKLFTGVGNELILENATILGNKNKPVWVRTPVIPGFTDDESNIREIALFIKNRMPSVERYDLLAFNNTCSSKYKRLDIQWELEGKELNERSVMEELVGVVRESGIEFASWSGLTKSSSSEGFGKSNDGCSR